MIETDLMIIGSGPGGYEAALYAANKGLKVVLAEEREVVSQPRLYSHQIFAP